MSRYSDFFKFSDPEGYIEWVKLTGLHTAPTLQYENLMDAPYNEPFTFNPTVNSGSTPVTFSVISGNLPSGLTLNASNGVISGTANVDNEGGFATIESRNPIGTSEFAISWNVATAIPMAGAPALLNTDPVAAPYHELYIQTGDLADTVFERIDGTYGYLTNNSGIWNFVKETGATKHAVYKHEYVSPVNGYSYAYFMQASFDTKWRAFRSNVSPIGLVNGAELANNLTGVDWGESNLIANEFEYQGITYSFTNSNETNEWYPYAGRNYLSLGNDASLDNFLTSSGAWSFMFRFDEDTYRDEFLGRPMFSHDGATGNYIGYKTSDAASYVFYGKEWLVDSGVQTFVTNVPEVIPSGAWMVVTCSASRVVNMYIDDVLVETLTWGSGQMLNSTESAGKNLHFGFVDNSSFAYATTNSTSRRKTAHGCWQGLIKDLSIANGTELTALQVSEISALSDITLSTNYSDITHAWRLDEVAGESFAALKGSVTGTGLTA